MSRKLESSVSLGKIGTKSYRTTIPQAIAFVLDVEEGDKLEWKMQTKNDKRFVIVRKID